MTKETIIIYGKENCPFCTMAKEILEKEGIKYSYIDIEHNISHKNVVHSYWNRHGMKPTVPLVFYNGEFIGGFKELKEEILKRT